MATGLFASISVNAAGANGTIAGNWTQVRQQLVDIVTVAGYAFAGTLIIGKVIDLIMELEANKQEETIGLIIAELGERPYGGL